VSLGRNNLEAHPSKFVETWIVNPQTEIREKYTNIYFLFYVHFARCSFLLVYINIWHLVMVWLCFNGSSMHIVTNFGYFKKAVILTCLSNITFSPTEPCVFTSSAFHGVFSCFVMFRFRLSTETLKPWNRYQLSSYTDQCDVKKKKANIRGSIQKFPDRPPEARNKNSTALCHYVHFCCYFMSQCCEFCCHNHFVASQQVFIFVSVYFVIESVRKLLDTPSCILFLVSIQVTLGYGGTVISVVSFSRCET
jgi:hypothetical protein